VSKPIHPGAYLRRRMESEGITQRQLARMLKTDRASINELVNCKRRLTPDMARRLGVLFGTEKGGWYSIQQRLDMWECVNASHDYGIAPLDEWKQDGEDDDCCMVK
jgi:addiction module HigA family antidote